MESVAVPGTDLKVSKWSLGTGSLHHHVLASKRRRLLDAAADAGFTHLDTSPYYGYGLAERDLGRFMSGQRARFTVATKVGLYPHGSPSATGAGVWVRKGLGKIARQISAPRVDWSVTEAEHSLGRSLARLRTDHVDILLLHEPDPAVVAADEFLGWLERERSSGRVRHFGLAGQVGPMLPWIHGRHGLAEILQVKDSIESREADVVIDAGRELQFTYGYLSGQAAPIYDGSIARHLRAVRQRNPHGSVIVSTRRPERLAAFAAAGEG